MLPWHWLQWDEAWMRARAQTAQRAQPCLSVTPSHVTTDTTQTDRFTPHIPHWGSPIPVSFNRTTLKGLNSLPVQSNWHLNRGHLSHHMTVMAKKWVGAILQFSSRVHDVLARSSHSQCCRQTANPLNRASINADLRCLFLSPVFIFNFFLKSKNHWIEAAQWKRVVPCRAVLFQFNHRLVNIQKS